uniref:Acyl-coenzyme A dehydrogenase n=1 Tax=viral metagenome TaxID=1070528 RepID=A0A6C0E4T0_9ZZZZ
MYRRIFNRVKSIIPKISETEITALKSGGVSIDREIFKGKVNYCQLYKPIQKSIDQISEKTMEKEMEDLLKTTGQNPIYPATNIHYIMNYLGKKGFLSMIIDKKYGGNRLSIETQSKILSKISSYNPSLGVATMVPNSLGPAELIQHYGTDAQKEYFLPKLADGTFIPCFGLTGPNNGSDAVGSIDEGYVEKIDGKTKIRLVLNKRYITLAPVSNLMGIAFRLNDPHGLLSNCKEGITLVLVESSQPGLLEKTFHNPNNAGFPNGTIKGTIFIDPEQVIGGPDKIGEGWKMLMECLAVGRGVSLPATANGSSKFITHAIMNYINVRKQFNMNIGNMETVREKFIDMYLNTWIIHTSVKFTNHILDSGSTPSVVTAIMKQQTTERARTILNHGMDIYSGSAICTGENNFFTNFYNASPVGITVEGSNTLTRGLIIFGQGLNKSHPYIFPIFQSIQDDNLGDFKNNFNKLVGELACNYVSLLNPLRNCMIKDQPQRRLDNATLKFSVLANFVALMGGSIKSKQMISGNMADILSNLYLSYGLLWYHCHHPHDNNKNNVNLLLRNECMDYLLNELEYKMNLVVDNYPISVLRPFLLPVKNTIRMPILENKNKLYKFILENHELHDLFKKDIYYKGTVLEKMENLRNLTPNTPEYQQLYQNIICVGEYPVQAP